MLHDQARAYLDALPADRREALIALCDPLRAHVPAGCEEGMQYGMLAWYQPHSLYHWGYHCDPKQPLPLVMVGNQKGHMAVHLFCLYVNQQGQDQLTADFAAAGKKIDMGKACLRFKKLEDLDLPSLGRAIARISLADFVARYESHLPAKERARRARQSKALS